MITKGHFVAEAWFVFFVNIWYFSLCLNSVSNSNEFKQVNNIFDILDKPWKNLEMLALPLAIGIIWAWTSYYAPNHVPACVYVLITHWWNLSGLCRWCTAARRRWRWTHPPRSSEQWWCHGRRCTVPLWWRGGWELHVDETTVWLIMTIKKWRNKVKRITMRYADITHTC